MTIRQFVAVCGVTVVAAATIPAIAQAPEERRNTPLTATQMSAAEKIVLDGRLDDAVWQRIAPMSEFYEYRDRKSVV